jgi:predicted enzyme related to lactoylglutathione lyase
VIENYILIDFIEEEHSMKIEYYDCMRGNWMKIGEVCLLTSDVIRLSNFYKLLFDVDNNSNDYVHQMILSKETTLTIYNDGIIRNENPQNICIAFTVDDVDTEFERLKALGVEIVDPPAMRPWGAKNMSFLDPDHNLITFRCFPDA